MIQQAERANEARGGGVEIKLTETAFRAFLRQYDGMIREHAAKSELWIFRKIFELQN